MIDFHFDSNTSPTPPLILHIGQTFQNLVATKMFPEKMAGKCIESRSPRKMAPQQNHIRD